MLQEKLRQLLPEAEVDVRTVSALLCGSAAAVLAFKWVGQRRIERRLEEVKQRRDQGLGQMEKAARQFKQQNPGVQTGSILSLSLLELAEKLKDESLSPDSVLYTYMEKAMVVTREVNCVTDFMPECEEQLREVKKQKEKGLLYGIPVSIKDNIGCKGHFSTLGLLQFLRAPQEDDCVLVKVLKRQGAIPFVKTNSSQSVLNYDCGNPLFGRTVNPHNHSKCSGGSSGGEGALVGGGGSILGMGSDVAGSIRLPSSFCGICGFKPTGNRLSTAGVADPVAGMNSVTSVLGPMARDVDSLALCMRALLCEDMFRLDPTVPPMPFNEQIYTSTTRLRIGFYDGDGYFEPSPSMRRAIHETKTLLQEAGHTLVPFTIPRIEHAVHELFTRALFADGAATLLEKYKGDLVHPTLRSQIRCYRIPILVKRILSFILTPVVSPLDLSQLC
uniref:Fatty-acid amide hydrolase 1 n=1 Tax=Sphenodon punctatus TaxID=8508 RepID=A0A8D0GYG2_SPHPU